MPNQTQTQTPLTELLAAFGLQPPPREPVDPEREPKDDPNWMAAAARLSQHAADQVARMTNCPCKACKLGLLGGKVAAFLQAETLRAAVTGDTAKLAAVLAKVEELKGAG